LSPDAKPGLPEEALAKAGRRAPATPNRFLSYRSCAADRCSRGATPRTARRNPVLRSDSSARGGRKTALRTRTGPALRSFSEGGPIIGAANAAIGNVDWADSAAAGSLASHPRRTALPPPRSG
jgi:hypothetical protein